MSQQLVIILAAGTGSRYGASLPKQFCNLNHRPLLMTTIDTFRGTLPSAVITVVLSESMHSLWRQLCRQHNYISPDVVYGGTTRLESVNNALSRYRRLPGDTIVLVHDGARPLVTPHIIAASSSLPFESDCRVPVIPVTDSLRHIEGESSHPVDRNRYVAVQTPQSATLATLIDAYSRPLPPYLTDDASVIEHAGYHNIQLIDGDPRNIKITNPGDIAIATLLTDTDITC